MPSSAAPHVLIYPFSAAGHIVPLLELAHRLSSAGILLTVAVTPNCLHLLDPLRSETLVLPETETPSRPGLHPKLRAVAEHHRPILLDWFRSHPSPPDVIISDYFLGWTNGLASELGIKRIVFSPSGAFSISVSFSVWRDLPEIGPDSAVSFPKLPSCPRYRSSELPHSYRNYRKGDPDWDFFRSSMLDNSASWGAIFNSFAEIERHYIEHVKREMGHGRVWAVGPLLPTGPAQEEEPSSLMAWLDNQPDCSVVYVCFGSRVTLTGEQEGALAAALENSGIRFVWCAREFSTVDRGFEDRVAGRGCLVRGWAPQVAILNHRAVAAFLTHCGWNSVLEGLAAGVVMLTWPMDSDQYTNAKLLVDQLGVGVRVDEGKEDLPDSGKLIRILSDSIAVESPKRDRAKEVKEAALTAVERGSSKEDLGDLVKKLWELKRGKKRTNRSWSGLVLISLLIGFSAIGLGVLFR